MASEEEAGVSRKRRRKTIQDAGPYTLRPLVDDVQLSHEGDGSGVEITCVDLLDGNLYVGTSAAEILHFVQIPADAADPSSVPTFILASRLQPIFNAPSTSSPISHGVQQILLLPTVNKACILCNGTLSFYTLPELSPAYNSTKVSNCAWIGGVDLNLEDGSEGGGVVIMIATRKAGQDRIRLVKVADEVRGVRNMDYAGSLMAVRRDTFACVADAQSYALLDVDRQQKIPLFPISSLNESAVAITSGQVVDISSAGGPSPSRIPTSARSENLDASSDGRGHGRNTSLGALVGGLGRRQESPRPRSGDRSTGQNSEPTIKKGSPGPPTSPKKNTQRETSPIKRNATPDKPLPAPPAEEIASLNSDLPKATPFINVLKPHIASPTFTEFLLTTGTILSDAGVGMFVNLEGDVVRGTLEFSKYPEAVIVDGRGVGTDVTPKNVDEDEEGYVLAVMQRNTTEGSTRGLEIQRWDIDGGDSGEGKHWLNITLPSISNELTEASEQAIGIGTAVGNSEIPFHELSDKLRLARLRFSGDKTMVTDQESMESLGSRTERSSENASEESPLPKAQTSGESGISQETGETPLPEDWETTRNQEESQFAQRFASTRSRVVLWSGTQIWWVVRSPLAIRLDARLDTAERGVSTEDQKIPLDRRKIIQVVNSIRGQEARTEAEFLSLGYIRQKAGLLLLMDLMGGTASSKQVLLEENGATEEALIEGSLDPRVVLSVIPSLCEEVVEGRKGIWVYGGLRDLAERFASDRTIFSDSTTSLGMFPNDFLNILKRYLLVWRRKKGFGSIADENEVFQTVDAALLHLLLQTDSKSPPGPAAPSSIRAELNAVVDHGVACFDRAVLLLEQFKRLYVLSRLYQSRKMARDVLNTWKRILEGEPDLGGEFIDGENEVRKYLIRIRDVGLFEEFGTWLARRNPKIGIRIFADEQSRVKLEPPQVVSMLKRHAPATVKEYLEHLVFGKNNPQYANDLIAFYLGSVLTTLETSEEARSTLAQSYESYRALRPPKPTYRQFITDNAVDEEWWQSRLRLLQLLGGSQGAASDYDVSAILERIEPYEQELVPEMIILDGKQARHQQALRLLTHGLGDFDTAINYCLMGGSSIFHPTSGPVRKEAIPSREEQAILFGYLLAEFLHIEDISDRIERTSELLERFGGWLDVAQVLNLIPDSWSVGLVSGFLISTLRRLVREKSETMVARALSGAENLMTSADLIGKAEDIGPTVEAAK
ncbi:MAG: hypothetical protein M1827_003392 [Pycnora praestabilis]|nr:MAG: hypothetical protein M1827_003392 [Pycnora praestabilis]